MSSPSGNPSQDAFSHRTSNGSYPDREPSSDSEADIRRPYHRSGNRADERSTKIQPCFFARLWLFRIESEPPCHPKQYWYRPFRVWAGIEAWVRLFHRGSACPWCDPASGDQSRQGTYGTSRPVPSLDDSKKTGISMPALFAASTTSIPSSTVIGFPSIVRVTCFAISLRKNRSSKFEYRIMPFQNPAEIFQCPSPPPLWKIRPAGKGIYSASAWQR